MSTAQQLIPSTPSPPSPNQTRQHERAMVLLPPATPSETTPSKPILAREAESIIAPQWGNKQEAVEWFLQLRRALKSIVYRFLINVQEARNIFEENDATSYLDYAKLAWALSDLWHGWKVFITENTMTTDFLADALAFCDFTSVIKFMKTPKRASRKHTSQMSSIRHSASSISAELHTLQARVNEAILQLEESDEILDIEQLPPLPQLPVFEDVPDPSTLQPPAQITEESPKEIEEEYVPAGWPRDPTTLDLDAFKPVWTTIHGYPGEMPADIKEIVGDGEDRTCKL